MSSKGSNFTRRRFIKNAGAIAAGIAAPQILTMRSALAAFPDRPIKVVVANTPGGPADLVGRMITAAIQQTLIPWHRQQSVLVGGAVGLLLVIYLLNIVLSEPLRAAGDDSDLSGDLAVTLGGERPFMTADFRSKNLDFDDLADRLRAGQLSEGARRCELAAHGIQRSRPTLAQAGGQQQQAPSAGNPIPPAQSLAPSPSVCGAGVTTRDLS